MPITPSNGQVTQTPPLDQDQANLTGVGRADQFAVCDRFDRFKQLKFDVSAPATGKTVTIAAGANASDIILTLPTTSGTLTTQAGLSSVTSGDNSITPTLSGGGTSLDLQFADPIGWLRQKAYLWDDMWGWANSGGSPLSWWTVFVSGGSFSYVYNTPSITNGHPGVSRVLAASSGQYAAIMSEQRQLVFDTSVGQHTFEAMISLEATATVGDDYEFVVGMADNYTAATIAQGAYFEYNRATTGANWQAKTVNGAGSSTTVDTGVAASTSWVKLKVVVNTSGHAIFYINGTQVADISTNIPSTSYPVNLALGIKKTGGSTARNGYIDYVYYEPKLTTSR